MDFKLYAFFRDFFLTRGITKKIYQRMRILYPSNNAFIYRKSLYLILSIYSLGLIVFGGMIFIGKIRMYYVMLTIGVAYTVIDNMIYERLSAIEYKLLCEFEKFISDVRFNFQYDGMIEEAIQDAINSSEYIMSIHGQQISEYLRSVNDKDEGNDYMEVAPNDFFLTFYTLCETVMTFGDKLVDGKSCFMKNIGYLKDDINADIIHRKSVQMEFMGLKLLAILPIFSIKLIEIWAISNINELKSFYYGIKGSVTTTIVVLISLIIYIFINRLKYPESFTGVKEKWLEQILNNSVIENITMKHIGRHYSHYFEMEKLLRTIASQYNVKEFLLKRIVTSVIAMFISNVFMLSIGVYAIKYIFAVAIIAGILTFKYHYFMLILKRKMLQLERENEIVRFQSVIMILMHMEWTTVEKILNWLEKFAIVFKYDIEKMNDQLCYKGIKVFDEMIAKTGFTPFERLLKCFKICDRVGVEDAFSGIEADRKYYFDKHNQENKKLLRNRVVIAKAAAFVPMCLIITFELIIPFVVAGINQLQSFTGSI